jgi:hypothetical protein
MALHEFDPEAHEADVAAYYERQARYEAFDQLIDLALDSSEVTVEEAIKAYKIEFVDGA